jgi:nucleoside-diphosphate-sugar epimerase
VSRGETILVTGAGGLLGRRTAGILRAAGADVVGVARRPAEGVDRLADLLDPQSLDDCVRAVRPTTVLHFAWATAHGAFWTDPTNLDWTAATLRLAARAAEGGARTFVGVGSCAEQPGPLPPTLYGIAKTAARDVLTAWGPGRSMGIAWAKLFYVYAQDEPTGKLISSAARVLGGGGTFTVSHPDDVLDFIHADDAAAALALIATTPPAGAIDVGTGVGRRVEDVLRLLAANAQRGQLQLEPEPHQPPLHVVADVYPLRQLGWTPRVDLSEGLRRSLAASV